MAKITDAQMTAYIAAEAGADAEFDWGMIDKSLDNAVDEANMLFENNGLEVRVTALEDDMWSVADNELVAQIEAA